MTDDHKHGAHEFGEILIAVALIAVALLLGAATCGLSCRTYRWAAGVEVLP